VQSYYEEFLKSDRVVALVSSGGSSGNDFREVTHRFAVQMIKIMKDQQMKMLCNII
jgi:hypothetical protein